MKKYILILLLVGLTSCAYFQERREAASACLADPICKADVQAKTDIVKAVADASGYPAAGAVAGSIATALLLFFARKKKEEPK
jgi:orotate phosphoribosyltransferase-like protein